MKERRNEHIIRQIWHFMVHLRWHYQVFILSGGYLLGAFYQDTLNLDRFLIEFLNVHLLLFGGATAYNSYWDKDEGPIGGLAHPPAMHKWMWPSSLILQILGLWIASWAGWIFVLVYTISMLFFWLYSTPLARWKGSPIKSMIAIGLSTGTNSFMMGYLAAGPDLPGVSEYVAALGVALVILSMYPVSQIFQIEEDQRRGDQTFAAKFGKKGVERFFLSAFIAGTLSIALTFYKFSPLLSLLFGVVCLGTGLFIWHQLSQLLGRSEEYAKVMQMKYVASFSFVLFILVILLLKF